MATDIYQDSKVVEDMKSSYCAAKTDDERAAVVEQLAQKYGKSLSSIRQKLVREGVYIKRERTSKDGTEVISKGKLVDIIDKLLQLNLTEAEATSLEKATKQTLKKIIKAISTE